MKFTHLHVHSHYSLLDGLPKIGPLLDYVKELGMDSIALTDHGVLYGAIDFYKEAKKRGIKPIIGSEVYLAYNRMEEKRANIDQKRYHLLLLVKDKEGYKNLVQIITKAHLQGFYYKPRIDEEVLKEHSKGLIVLSGCIQGKIPRLIISNKDEEAKETALRWQKIFGKGNFFLEIQHHPNIPEQKKVNDFLIKFSKESGIPLVATNDSHYLKKEDAEAQDILMLINTGSNINDTDRASIIGDDFSLKSPKEMIESFKDVPDAIENTEKIKDSCNFQFELGEPLLPHFDLPEGKTKEEYLEELCRIGLKKRYKEITKEIEERLNYELSIIKKLQYPSYFLIVQDLVNWAKEKRIVVGPGRGSAAGSLVSYVLGITNVDPIKHGLIFERFLNPGRTSGLPDIDLDFTDRRRDEVIEYVAQKYGRDKVAQIITFGTMAARAVIRDVGRVLNYPYSYCDKMAKMIPFGYNLEKALKKVDEFKELYSSDEEARRLIDIAKKLEGVIRHASTHACGVVISPDSLLNYVPLQRPTQNENTIVTQYEMHSIESLGLLKMDFLGLKNLTIIEDTLARIYVIRGEKIDIENLPENDEKTYQLLREANAIGIFQLESGGMRRYLKELEPTCFEDIEVMIALYRPGPMELIPSYIKRKKKEEEITYLHPKLRPILEKTQGIMVYQEQLMKMAQEIAGFSLSEADVLRKAVGKKIKELLKDQEKKFIEGCVKNNVQKKTAEKLWQWILPFASYGFNKCVSGETKIIDTENGRLIKVKDLYENKKLVKKTFSIDKENKVKESKITDVIFNGIKPTFELKTKSGKKITTTDNHPFLTPSGWKDLKEIKEGERIATPRIIHSPKKVIEIEDYRVTLLGYLLAEGNFCHPSGFYFYSNSKEEINDYIKNLEKFKNTTGKIDYSKSAIAVYSKRKEKKEKSEAVEWIREVGLGYKKATEKFFPEFVFQLSNKQLSILIAKMFQGDGCINLKQYPSIFYATSSKDIAENLSHLLLRFGIISTIHKKEFKYRQTKKIGYTINISRYDNIKKFIDNFSFYLLSNKRNVLKEIEKKHPILNGTKKIWSAHGSIDIIPASIVRPLIRTAVLTGNLSFKETAEKFNFSNRLFLNDPRKIGYLRETVQHISQSLKIKELEPFYHSDIFWDKVISIKNKGKEETYDLTIEGTHNFIANDIFVHNSHSTAYAMIAYQTAYLKAHYPVEFMASLLTSEKNDTERVAMLIEECKKMNIEVLPPDINQSLKNFTVIPGERKITFGMLAIKNVGEGVIDKITEERKKGEFKSIGDFIERTSSKEINKKSLESLIKTGTFDRFEERNKLLHNLERLLQWSREISKTKANGQIGLFSTESLKKEITLSDAEPLKESQKLKWEKELLGLYISSHPLSSMKDFLEKNTLSISKINHSLINKKVKLGGIISKLKKIITKNGKVMIFLTLEDLTEKAEITLFPSVIENSKAAIEEEKIVFIKGRVDKRNGDLQVVADEIEEIIS